MGKGSKRRPGNQQLYREAYAKIWGQGSYCECGFDLTTDPKHMCEGVPTRTTREREALQDNLDRIDSIPEKDID